MQQPAPHRYSLFCLFPPQTAVSYGLLHQPVVRPLMAMPELELPSWCPAVERTLGLAIDVMTPGTLMGSRWSLCSKASGALPLFVLLLASGWPLLLIYTFERHAKRAFLESQQRQLRRPGAGAADLLLDQGGDLAFPPPARSMPWQRAGKYVGMFLVHAFTVAVAAFALSAEWRIAC